MAPPTSTTAIERAQQRAQDGSAASIELLARLVRVPSLTGEEGPAQGVVAEELRVLGAEVHEAEPDVAALFERFPRVAQYPTHWQHDLILPYDELPTYEALRASGLESVLHYRGRPNVVGHFKGHGGGRSLILNAHVDTVTIEPRDRWRRDPWGAQIDAGRMYGRGTSDMKGGLAAALMAMRWLRDAGVVLAGDVIVQSVVNEEHAGNGTLDLVRRGWRADGAVVLEPTGNRICVSHTGGLYWQVTVPGTARSPGARWRDGEQDGVSAIEKLPAVIGALLDVEREAQRRAGGNGPEPDHSAFALVMGRILGGHYETLTAQEVLVKGGAYFSPRVGSVWDVMRSFSAAMDDAARKDRYLAEFRPRMSFLHHDDATEQSETIAPAQTLAAVLRSRGADASVRPGPFCCDLRHLVNQGGMPAVIFGPGSIAQAHTADEHIVLAEYLDCIGHLIPFIAQWCNAEPAP